MAAAALSCARALWVVLALGAFVMPAAAESEAPVSVLLVRSSGDDRLANALRAELISYRYRVLEIAPRAADRSQALPALAQKYEVEAAVRVDATKNAVELWVDRHGNDEPSSDETVGAPSSLRPELLAVRVTETMRARGLRLPAPQAEHSQPSAATNAAVAAAAGTVGDGAVATTGIASTAAASKAETVTAAAAHDQPAAEPARQAADAATPPSKAAAIRPSAEAEKPPAKAAGDAADKPPAKPPAARPPGARLPPSAAEKPKPPVPPPSAADVTPKPSAPEPANPKAASARLDTGAPPPGQAPTTDHGALVYAEVGTAGVFSPGGSGAPGLGPAFDLWLDLRLQPYRTTSLSLFVLAPLLETSIKDPDGYGTGSVRTFLVGGSVDLHMQVQPFELSFGLAAGALLSSITAQPTGTAPPTGPKLVHHEVPLQRTAALLARAGVSYQLVDELRVTARAMAGVGVPELTINFGDKEVATSGLPLIVATLGLELALPWQR